MDNETPSFRAEEKHLYILETKNMLIHNDRNEDSLLESLQSLRREESRSLFALPNALEIEELVSGSEYQAGCCFVDPETNEIHVEMSRYFDVHYRAYYLARGEVRLGEEYIAKGEDIERTKLFEHTGPPVILLSEKFSNGAWYNRFGSGHASGCLDVVADQDVTLSILCQPNDLLRNAFYLTNTIGPRINFHGDDDASFKELLEQFGLRYKRNRDGSSTLQESYQLIRLTDGEAI